MSFSQNSEARYNLKAAINHTQLACTATQLAHTTPRGPILHPANPSYTQLARLTPSKDLRLIETDMGFQSKGLSGLPAEQH